MKQKWNEIPEVLVCAGDMLRELQMCVVKYVFNMCTHIFMLVDGRL